jgi:hypothetical protein
MNGPIASGTRRDSIVMSLARHKVVPSNLQGFRNRIVAVPTAEVVALVHTYSHR